MRKICANFTISTPMFLGGADNQNTAELRPTSVKGVMRFWFRAINYGKYQDYKKVKNAEDELFGSTNSQSSFFLKLDTQNVKSETKQSELKKMFDNNIFYLGYGLDYEKETIEEDTEIQKNKRKESQGNKTEKLYRHCLIPGQTFTVELLIKPKHQDQLEVEDLIKPIKALGLFGGLGSRSRRGFGSVTLNSIYVDDQEYWVAPNSRVDLENTFKDFYQNLEISKGIPEYTAFSKNNRTIILEEFSGYREALKEVGKVMMEFRRGYGKDAEIVCDYLEGNNVDKHPERVIFGLPHNYFISGKGKVDINPIIDKERTRRSSPLFIKIISIKEGTDIKYIPVMTVFPSEFLPKGIKISLEGEGKGRTKLERKLLEPKVSFNPDPINELIDVFKKSFPNALEVRP